MIQQEPTSVLIQIETRTYPIPWRGALLMCLRNRATMVREPEVKGSNDIEVQDVKEIWRRVFELMQSIPSTRYRIDKDKLDEIEQTTFNLALQPIFQRTTGWIEKHELMRIIQSEYPHIDMGKDPQRRLRSIAGKGWILKDNRADGVYYRLPE